MITRRQFIEGAAVGLAATAVTKVSAGKLGANEGGSPRVIAVEEAYATQTWVDEIMRMDNTGAEGYEVKFFQSLLKVPAIKNGLVDFDQRVRVMDETGIDMHLLSLTVPGVQMMAPNRATAVARDMNDELADVIKKYPGRFAGLAIVPPQAPEDAAKEIERAVGSLGLNGVIINSHTQGEYLDEARFSPLLAAAEATGAAIYLHPRMPSPAMIEPYQPHSISGAIWGFAAEAGLHAMRLILSGVFDRYPKLQIVLGHMGESLPFWSYRLDNIYSKLLMMGGAKPEIAPSKLELLPSEYLKRNISITTSGMEDPEVLDFCIKKVGVERIMFAIDYPYENSAHAAQFLKSTNLSSLQRNLISHANAERIFNISAKGLKA